MHKWIYLLPLLAIIIACGKDSNESDLPTVNNSITRAETYYDLKITEIATLMEVGDSIHFGDSLHNLVNSVSWDIECNWDPDIGIITFSSENPGSSPYPTVTIIYDLTSGESLEGWSEEANYSYRTFETSISLQDVLIGTATELNARTYIAPYLNHLPPRVLVTEVGSNFIHGWIEGKVYKRIFDQSGNPTGEVVEAEVRCDFRVCTGC